MNRPDFPNARPATLTQLRRRRRARGRLFRSAIRIGGGGRRRANNDTGVVSLNGSHGPNQETGLNARPQEERRDPYRRAFGLLYLFTLLLYLRPNDLIPAMGTFPLAKIVAIIAPLAFIYAQHQLGKPIINWTIEVKMVFVMLLLAILFTPIAASPTDSVNTLNEVFIKAVIIFILLIGLINTRERLRSIIGLTVICGAGLAVFAIRAYATGNFSLKGDRIEGIVGGIFGNPNDLAVALNMLIPLAVKLALISAGRARQLYGACALLMTAGVIVTFSRAGFLTLVALSGVMVWKFGRGMRVKAVIGVLIPSIILLASMSDGYRNRLTSITDYTKDESGSAQQRSALMKHGLDLAIRHPFIGVGIGNFHSYSIREKVAHNGYIETAAELGSIGLIAYLILILAPLRGLARIERETLTPRNRGELNMKYLSIGLQAALVAYIVNSFFLSIQYLWYIYYAAGYAVALRQIYAAEKAVQANGDEAATSDQLQPIGKLWKPAPRKPAGALWPAYRFRRGF